MADDKKKEGVEIFDQPFELEPDKVEGEEGYVGAGFEGALEIVTESEGEEEPEETDEEKVAREAKEKEAAASKKESDSVEVLGTTMANALERVTNNFGQQLANMNTQFTERMDKLAARMETATKPAVKIPDAPTDKEWEDDANAAFTKMQKRNEALKLAEKGEEADTPAEEEGAAPAAEVELKASQNDSYADAVKIVPDITQSNSREREVFTKIYFNDKYNLSNHPQGPVLAALATQYYFQKNVKSGESGGEGGDEGKGAEKSPEVVAAEKIIADSRAKKHGMTRSGTKEKGSKAKIPAEGMSVIKQFGISEESYRDGMESLGIGG